MALRPHTFHDVELCTGERCVWEYLGLEEDGDARWCDVETGREFREGSLMYAWRLLGERAESPAARDELAAPEPSPAR